MLDVAEIGRRQLADALARTMKHCEVTEWPDDDGNPCPVYWRPVTGAEQIKIDSGKTEVDRVCLTVHARARHADGQLIFKNTPLASLKTDYDYDVIRAIAYIIASDMGTDEQAVSASDDPAEAIVKE